MSFLKLWILLGSLTVIATLSAQEPMPVAPHKLAPLGTATVSSGPELSNQQLADAVAQGLKQSARLQRFHIDIQVGDGHVQLTGRVSDAGQREEALRLARAVPGVRQVFDRLQVTQPGLIIPVQGVPEEGPAPQRFQTPPQEAVAQPLSQMPPAGPANGGLPAMLPPSSPSMPQEPMPISQVPAYDPLMQPPPMPPFAWPTYAPYNNYSRVAYPTLYPYEAWPYIGPMYPFPKVPPGWRSVTLTWNDGFWWYGRNATGHDWWRIKYR